MKYLALLLLTGCNAAPALFETPCGLRFIQAGEWTPEIAAEYEARALEALKGIADPRFANACEAMRGVEVNVRPSIYLDDKASMGLAYCPQGRIEIGNQPPWASSLAHEMTHIVQGCESEGTDQHVNWWELRIYDVLVSIYPT